MNPTAPTKTGPREWVGLVVLTLPTLLIAIDMNVLHLAVPQLTEDLKPSSSQLLWIIDIYGFLIAASLITMGKVGDRIGRRKLLMLGAAAFGGASVLAAFAPTPELLIAARALLGIAGATLMPSTMSLIRTMFTDPAQRRSAIAVWMTAFVVGSALGPLVGGAMLENFWWGSVFLLGVPVMVVLLIAGPLLLPEYRDPKPGRVDLVSVVLSLAAILTAIYGIKRIAEDGPSALAIGSIAAGVVLGAVFARRQRALADPLLDLGLFRITAYRGALVAQTLAVFAMGGFMLFSMQYLQLVAGLSPLDAGLVSLPGTVASIAGTMLAPALARRFRPSTVMAAGMVVSAAGVALIVLVEAPGDVVLLVAGLGIVMLGLGPTMSLTTDLIMGSVPPERAGTASAMSETAGELGMALGVAILGSIGTAIYRAQIPDAIGDNVPAPAAEAITDTLGGAMAATAELPGDVGKEILAAARVAFTDGMHVTAGIGVVILLGIAVLVAVTLRHSGLSDDDTEVPAEKTTVAS